MSSLTRILLETTITATENEAESGRPIVFETLKHAERKRRPVRGDRGVPMNLLRPELVRNLVSLIEQAEADCAV